MLAQALTSVPPLTVLNGISSGNEITDVRRLGESQNTLETPGFSSSYTVGKNRPVSQETWAPILAVRRFLPTLHFSESLVISSKPAKQLVSISTRQVMC